MKIRSFLFGLGSGLIVLSLLFFIIYEKSAKKPTEQEIEDLAREIGMIFAYEVELDDDTDIDQDDTTEDENYISGEAVSQTPLPTENETENNNFEMSEIQNIEIQSPNIEAPTVETPVIETPTIQTPTVKTPTIQSPPLRPKVTDEDGSYTIDIPRGATAKQVAEELYNAGLIEDSQEFQDYMIEQNATKKIISGNFFIDPDDDYETVLDKISR